MVIGIGNYRSGFIFTFSLLFPHVKTNSSPGARTVPKVKTKSPLNIIIIYPESLDAILEGYKNSQSPPRGDGVTTTQWLIIMIYALPQYWVGGKQTRVSSSLRRLLELQTCGGCKYTQNVKIIIMSPWHHWW